jgi:hypothetical protein
LEEAAAAADVGAAKEASMKDDVCVEVENFN